MPLSTPTAALRRSWETGPGPASWLCTVDHKKIGSRYLLTAFFFFLAAGLMALVMRSQLALPENGLLSPEEYDQLFTMHGTIMIFFFASPILSGFSNYLIPLMIGSRDMAFPRLNAFSYWSFLFSGVFMLVSLLGWAAPRAGWFSYVPYASIEFSPGRNMDVFALGLIFLTISTTAGAINFIVTIFTLRAPGMSINRTPLFLWSTLTTSVSIVFALPALTAALLFLELDRRVSTHFFDAAAGGTPLLWQQLFWMFGHPWVYIVVLPALGMISMILPTFSRRKIVGYPVLAMSTVMTGLLGFGVWEHHMFSTGLPPLRLSFFSAASMTIVIPSGVTLFAWLLTLWTGRLRLSTPLLFVVGFFVLFTIGGVSGVMTAAIPLDLQLTDTYFVVAHLHYVLVGINVFPVIAAFYYWLPKITGRMLSEGLGRWSFWTMFIGFNLAFFPMHILGILGMPRRVYTYLPGLGWDVSNLLVTIGSFAFAAGVLLFIANVVWSRSFGTPAGNNPWGASSLEWLVPSPPPEYNFETIPRVRSRDPLWDQPLEELTGGPVLPEGHETVSTSVLDGDGARVLRMPERSIWPLLLAAALLLISVAVLFGKIAIAIAGATATLVCVIGWLWPATARAEADDIGAGATDPTSSERAAKQRGHKPHTPAWWGMVWVITTEASLFAYLIASYWYLESAAVTWPPEGAPELRLAVINTAILLASSGTLYWAERGLRRGSRRRLHLGVAATLVLGMVFLTIQGVEYAGMAFTPRTDAYGSAFFTITGLHGAHVFVGLLILGFVGALSLARSSYAGRSVAVRNAALYWHFVDAVWLVVFSSLYLAPHFT